jgi:hypothetical protein
VKKWKSIEWTVNRTKDRIVHRTDLLLDSMIVGDFSLLEVNQKHTACVVDVKVRRVQPDVNVRRVQIMILMKA